MIKSKKKEDLTSSKFQFMITHLQYANKEVKLYKITKGLKLDLSNLVNILSVSHMAFINQLQVLRLQILTPNSGISSRT